MRTLCNSSCNQQPRPRDTPKGRLYYGAVSDDSLASVRSRTQANLFWRHLGVAVEDARPGWVRLRLPVRNDLCNAAGAPLHGGVLASLVDMAVGGALPTMGAAPARGGGPAPPRVNGSVLRAPPAGGGGRPRGRLPQPGRPLAVRGAATTH